MTTLTLEPTEPVGSTVERLARSWWAGGVAVHLATLLVALVALLPFMRIGTSFTSDDGAYGLQVSALEDGGWALRPPSAAIDPELEFPPWEGVILDDGIVPYDRHPAYPRVLQALTKLTGGIDGALLVTGIGGVLLTAAGAWCLARELRPGAERLAFWLAATSPMALHAYVLWAHAPAAAAAVWASVFLMRAIRERRIVAWALCGLALVSGLLLRSESLLLALSLVIAAGVVGLLSRRRDIVVGVATIGVGVVAAVLVERHVIAGISRAGSQALSARGAGNVSGDLGYLGERVEGLRRSLLEGSIFSSKAAAVAQLGVLLLFGSAVLYARRGRSPLILGCAGVGLALLIVRAVSFEGDPIPGLLVAWPVAAVGLVGAWAWAKIGDVATRVLVAGSALATLSVLATQYADGGGGWGGRFFTMLVPLLAVFAAVAWNPTWRVERRAWISALLAVSVVSSVAGLQYVRARRGTYDEVSASVAVEHVEAAVTVIPFLPRSLWRDDQAWMLASGSELEDALGLARRADVGPIVVAVPNGWRLPTDGWRIDPLGVVAPSSLNIALYRLTPG